jgi:hypothetical protein
VLTIKKPKYIFVVIIFRNRLRTVLEYDSLLFRSFGPMAQWPNVFLVSAQLVSIVYPWAFSNSIILRLIYDEMLLLLQHRTYWSLCPNTSTCFKICGLPVSTSTLLPPFFESLHSFPQALAVNDVLNCHFSTKPESFHTLWAQKSDRHFLFTLTEMCEWNSHVILS